MIAVQLPVSLPSTYKSSTRIMKEPLPSLPHLRDLEQHQASQYCRATRRAVGPPPFEARTHTVATVRHGLRTPPSEMHEMNVNPLLVPEHGPLQYRGVPVVAPNTATHQSSLNSMGSMRYASRVPPSLDTYQSAKGSQSPQSGTGQYIKREQSHRRGNSDGTDIVHYLQIPRSINDSKGSLSEFSAQITCLFWFESSVTLQQVEDARTTFSPTEPLVPEAMPSTGFRKWVTTILSTTQVTQNVILLALMFIYRLKRLNPGVKGKLGSEFRLLTVALMLGNKFLDDNTYTNKTWAEVSGISVQEIHIMEVEFLSNMRYTLFVSEIEWQSWHIKLGRFWSYFDKASKKPFEAMFRNRKPPQSTFAMPPDLPSPPASTNTSPPFLPSQSFSHQGQPHQISMPSYLPPSIPSPVGPMPEADWRPSGRKRSHDDHWQEPPAKRPASSILPSSASSATITPSTAKPSALRLPTPNLSIPTTSQSFSHQNSPAPLPPPVSRPSSGALSALNRWPQNTSLPSLPQSSPFSASYIPGSATPSPTSFHFPQSQQSSNHPSPAAFPPIQHSPYKPVRRVNTLLVPPPSASLYNPPQHLGNEQMRYQPLGKPVSERKTGVPPFMHQHTWAQPPPVPYYLPQPTIR